ncbi:MAG: hypothetical protein J2P19_16485 [Pseudonocardia sp.]|nr:hypothetical protein [Pseudonocardia sp.]
MRAHAGFGSAEDVIAQRRAVYRLAVELLGDGKTHADPDVLDNPMVRAHLGSVLSGDAGYRPAELRPLSEVTGPAASGPAGRARVAGRPAASPALGPALARVATELRRHDVADRPPELLTESSPEFPAARRRLLAGIALAAEVVPALAADLLPHVAAFALVRDESGRLGSASAREYPGLVALPAPRSVPEAAEALIHEGAHQKFFDLAITRTVFGANQYSAPPMHPSWTPGAAWPLEQTFAAWHAYRCLTALAEASDARLSGSLTPASLLPTAAERAAELGSWLSEHGEYLGTDGHDLLESVDGYRPVRPAPTSHGSAPLGPSTSVRRIGDRTLVARRTNPIEVYWLADSRRPDREARSG